ncbi:MAG: ribose ABC transporter [Hyphomicrobiaceae bacterium]|nr:ribose ABC transporter [Hyphomicrobiaceae bacterium]MCC0023354.1 ribose ABC transporter [Hyphomicrobiaceae bacterium]
MLKNINPLLSPDLLHVLASMGHGDELAIVDANFPAAVNAKRLVRLPAIPATDALSAVLSVLPLDDFVSEAAYTMEVVGGAAEMPEVVAEFRRIVGDQTGVGTIERFAFYERSRNCFAIVQTGELRLYGNIILTKGVVRPVG